MSWPLASHFSAMLQKPRFAFRDPRLQACRIEKDQRNQPRPWAGAFAVVYKAYDAQTGEPFAVRVFTTESPERRERYDLISAYLAGRKLNCLVEFEYRDRSIRSAGDGKWYPLILMEWVQGDTLFQWARARALAGDRSAFGLAAERWAEVVRELAQHNVTHGDLQHANVMVTPLGELKLVDYDCMCVPALVGRRNLEVGVEPYQHPGRNEHTLLSLDLDHFSALVIYVALRALAVDPSLWQRHVEAAGYDKMLFRREDFQSPNSSVLMRELGSLPDAEVRELVRRLTEFYHGPIDAVPALAALANSYAEIERLLNEGRWQTAVKLLNRRGQFRDAPEHLKPLIQRAYHHVCRQGAWHRFQQVPERIDEQTDRRLVEAWNESLFAGFDPAERQRVRVAEARRRVDWLDRLRYLVQQSSGRLSFGGERSIVEAAGRLPEGYPHALAARVEQARRRVRAVSKLDQAIRSERSEAGIVAAWRAVLEADAAALVEPEWQQRVALAERRAPLLAALAAINPQLPAHQLDRALLEIWNTELLTGCREAQPWARQHAKAVERREALARLETAVGTGDEPAMVAAMEEPALKDFPLPPDWAPRVRRAQQRAARLQPMLDALGRRRLEEFLAAFDAGTVRAYPERFEAHRELLETWTSSQLLSAEAIGLATPGAHTAGGESIVRAEDPAAGWCVRWNWPEARMTDQCLVGVADEEPRPCDRPEDLPLRAQWPVERGAYESQGSFLLPDSPESAGGYVIVWAVIDIGFQRWTSDPLLLGRLAQRSRLDPRNWRLIGRLRQRLGRSAAEALPADNDGSAQSQPGGSQHTEPSVLPCREETDSTRADK